MAGEQLQSEEDRPNEQWRKYQGVSTGTEIECEGWPQEAALRMFNSNLDPEVAEKPEEFVVCGGSGRAARNWDAYNVIIDELCELDDNGTLLIQSGKPVGQFLTHERSSRVLLDKPSYIPTPYNFDVNLADTVVKNRAVVSET